MYSACTYVAAASTVVSSFLPGETLLAVGTAWRVSIWYPVGLVLRGQSHSCKAKPCNKRNDQRWNKYTVYYNNYVLLQI